jgi:(R,R)-butanediol dehydrogenase / meso-butanediol dehydrogenase / diacetyl reductase
VKALRFHAARDLRIEDVAEPGAPGPTQVTVAPRWCGICGTDLHEYTSGPIVTPSSPHPLTGATLPQILGHELSAEVVAVGSAVNRVAVGDRVSVMPLIYCGRCDYCRRGLQHLCVTMACTGLSADWGGISELANLEEYQVFRIPDAVSDEQGALIEPCAVAAYGVSRGPVRPGDSVLIAGAGPIGAFAALCAAAAGAGSVYLTEPNESRRERARRLDLGEVFDPEATDVPAELHERTDGLGVDIAIECAGFGAAFRTCVESVKRRGTVVQVGLHVQRCEVDPMLWALNDLKIVGSWCYGVNDWPRVAAQIASGRLPVERVVTGRLRMEEAESGFQRLTSGATEDMKVLISMNSTGSTHHEGER